MVKTNFGDRILAQQDNIEQAEDGRQTNANKVFSVYVFSKST